VRRFSVVDRVRLERVGHADCPVLKMGEPISVRHAELSGVSVSATL
jgi:hypothetical protein